jgi:beta-N-acetylhexosaminidase
VARGRSSQADGSPVEGAESSRKTDPAGQLLLTVFGGETPPAEVLEAVRTGKSPGVALYRALNVRSPGQVRDLTLALEAAAREGKLPPPLVCVDQEGGQLVGIGPGTTPFPGNLALGAVGDPRLAERVGRAIGLELAAMGVSVDWAPVCDLATHPANPAVGARSFGDDPVRAADLAASAVRGIRSAGVASAAKHFPGAGATGVDPHVGLPVLDHDIERLRQMELAPFRAAIEAGVDLVMAAHVLLPRIDPVPGRSAMRSPRIVGDLLRDELGFGGVCVTDALDMGAVDQGSLATGAIDAVAAGVDVLLPGPAHAEAPDRLDAIRTGLAQAAADGRLVARRLAEATGRVRALRRRLGSAGAPPLSVVNGSAHRALAQEVARRAVTLVRDRDGQLPLRAAEGSRVLVIVPRPADLTPADTSSFLTLDLAEGLRRRWPAVVVDELVVPIDPSYADAVAARDEAVGADLVVLGTINAFVLPGQLGLARAVLAAGRPTVLVCFRMPHDAVAMPEAGTVVAAYGIEAPTIDAVADVLTGALEPTGRLPVRL